MSLNQYPRWADEAAKAVRDARAAMDRIVEIDRELATVEMDCRAALERLARERVTTSPVIIYCLERLQRMRELQSMKEIGGFMIKMDHELQEAWRKLP